MDKAFLPRQAAFIAEYRSDRNASRAYTAAYGTKGPLASSGARTLLKKPRIRAEIARLDSIKAARLEIDTDKVLLDALQVLFADARDLIEYRVGACRNCYGEGHGYQRTVGEMNRDREKWVEKEHKPLEAFDTKGGIGFSPLKPPADDCPECHGAGAGRAILRDTRHLPVNAIRLYAGLKEGPHGIQVLMRSQDNAREVLMKHLGLFAADNKQRSSTPLGEALVGFVKQMHSEGAGKAPVVEHGQIRRVK